LPGAASRRMGCEHQSSHPSRRRAKTQDYGLNTLIVEQGATSVINRGYTYWYDDFNISNVWDNIVTARNENYV